jgi:hypothetical protein
MDVAIKAAKVRQNPFFVKGNIGPIGLLKKNFSPIVPTV